jgi:serine/threonine protein kinase
MADPNSDGIVAKSAHFQGAGICGTCGRPMTQRGPSGECLRCLVSLAFLPDCEPSEQRSAANRRVTAGPLRYAHFEVEVGEDGFPVELGAGAMAVTYRARDTVLNSVVALKVIDRKAAENPAARSRFLREARAAAQLHHPNVARVTHYGEQNGECFYAMELVEGETLEARVRREGPMPLALALKIIEQALRALAAADACGVVHRDIKPSNLMIASPQGESETADSLSVKVIDFGIAKLIAGESEIGAEQTQVGFIGTPAFASPEQFADVDHAAIDSRSDIYSLGVTFWYLLCGRTPFAGQTLEEIRARQGKELPAEQLKTAHVPATVVELLKSMLAVDPGDRPQSARELLTAVHRCYERFEPRARSRRGRFGLTMVAAALVIAAIAFGLWAQRKVQSSAEMERSIAVLPFENLSPNTEDAFFTVGMQDEITADLARLSEMKVIGAQSTRSYLPGKGRNFVAIARELGVRHLLEGSVRREADQVRIAVRLVDVRDQAHPWARQYDGECRTYFHFRAELPVL